MPTRLSDEARSTPVRPPRLTVVASVVAVSLLGACSQVPDAVNPVEWYRGTADWIAGDDEEDATEAAAADEAATGPAAERGQPAPGADEPFPNLATVPDRPEVDSAAERREIAEGLVADREQARYSTEVIRRQGEIAEASPPPAVPAPTASAPPSPSASAPAPPSSEPSPPESMSAPERPAPSPPVPAVQPPPMPSMAESTSAPSMPAPPPTRPPQAAESGSVAGDSSTGRTPASVAEVFRQRVAEQGRLPSQNRAENSGGAPMDTGAGGFGTVVVSSNGVESPGTMNVAGRGVSGSASSFARSGGLPSGGTLGPGFQKVATIIFNNGSARLSDRDRGILRDVLALHRERGGRVHIIGHASSRTRTMDPTRHNMVNYQMSVARADAVADALAGLGLPREAILVAARSDSEPLYFEVMPTGEAGNRRAEIYLES